MIENKIITVKKSNTFDKGWTLVTPYHGLPSKNRHFSALLVSDIVRAITQSSCVNLILSEPCLSSQIVKELEWVNKYIAINLIARNKEVINRYSSLNFDKVEINESIDFNYIAIKGKTDLYVLITEDFVTTDETLNSVYFDLKPATANFDFLKGAKFVLFADRNNDKNYADLLDFCLKNKIPTQYMVGSKAYNRDLVHKFSRIETDLLCSDKVVNGILYSTCDGILYFADLTDKGVYVSVEIERAEFYTGQPFKSLKSADDISVDKIPEGTFVSKSGKITPFKIEKQKIIKRTVQIDVMEDFVLENFDKSETDKHNQYCAEAEEVIYNFTLVPPLFNTDKFSDIYNCVETIHANWKEKLKLINLKEIISFLKDLELDESGLCLLCEEVIGFDKRLNEIIKSHNYKNFYSEVKALSEMVDYSSLDVYCMEMFSKLNAENLENKFDKFDDEIAGYRQTIEEKKALLANSKAVNILLIKNRIKALESKIADLTAMKHKFSGSASARDTKRLDAFLAICKQVIAGKFIEENREIDSIGNVLAVKELTKVAKLEIFVKTYLYGINRLMGSVKEILGKFESVDIPTEYVVYEQGGKRVIAIDSEKEYYDTEKIRKQYGLHCVARR